MNKPEDTTAAGELHSARISTLSITEQVEAEPWPDPVDGSELLEDIAQVLRRYVVLPKFASEALALWVLHTYAWELREVTTYLGVESPTKRCGKTTLLTVLIELVNRPLVAANISSPAFFRVIEEIGPTLLIDEADTLLQGNEELRGILNAGYSRKTAFVVRVGTESGLNGRGGEGARTSRLARFSCWCPKAMAAIGRLPETLADRCIVIRMQRKTGQEPCERLRGLDGSTLRRRCARFVSDQAAAISAAGPEIPKLLNDRAGDIWEPLLALADLAGNPWPEVAREAASHLSGTSTEASATGALLLDLFVAFRINETDRLPSRAIVARLNAQGERPWSSLCKGRPVTDLWLSQQLRPFGVRSRSVWIEGVSNKGYFQEDLMEVFRRYISRSELDELRAESGQS